MRAVLRTLLLLQALVPVHALAADEKLSIELNSIETADNRCRVNFVVEKSPDGMLVRPERRPQIPGFLAEAVSHAYARYTPEEME